MSNRVVQLLSFGRTLALEGTARTRDGAGNRAALRQAGSWALCTALFAALLVPVPVSAWAASPDRHLVDSIETQYESSNNSLFEIDSSTTLDDYLVYAALNSPSLRQSFYRWRASLDKTGYAGALPDPVISYGHYLENVETRTGPQNQRLSIKQTIPWFGTLGSRKDMAKEAGHAAFQRFQAEKLRLFYSVKAAYYELYFLGRDIGLTQDNLELLTFWEAVARTKYKVALTHHRDVIKAQVELGKIEDHLLTLKDKIAPAAARLRALVNLPDSAQIMIPGVIDHIEETIDFQSVMNDALRLNPNLGAFMHEIERERAGVRLAGKSSWPNFQVGLDYIATGEALNPALTGSGKDPVIVGVGINLPIWFGKNRAKKREAVAKLRAAEYGYSDARNRLRALVEEIVFRHSDALRKSRLYRDGLIPKAEQVLNASYTAYQAAETDFLNVLDAQRQLLAFQLQFERAIVDLSTRRAEIEMIAGHELNQIQTRLEERKQD